MDYFATVSNADADAAYETRWEKLKESPLLTNPLNVVLLLIALYLFVSLITPFSIDKLTPTLSEARSPARNPSTSYSYLPDDHPPCVVWRKYTPRTLAVFDGSGFSASDKDKANGTLDVGASARKRGEPDRILLAIQGKVFDVTKGSNFYGPGGPYGNFAGRDASRGMAKQSFDLDMLTPLDQPLDKLEDLTPMELSNMREWDAHFTAKYGVVGELVNEGEEGE